MDTFWVINEKSPTPCCPYHRCAIIFLCA